MTIPATIPAETATNGRLAWPFPSVCKLTAHPNGQWSKKYKGRVFYFGPHADAEGARDRWLREWPRIARGVDVTIPADTRAGVSLTVFQVCNRFLEAKSQALARGDLVRVTWQKYKHVCKVLVSYFGPMQTVADLSPDDFASLLTHACKTMGVHRRQDFVTVTRMVFGWALASKLIAAPVDFGPDFTGPPARVKRQHKLATGDRSWTAAQIRAMLAKATDPQLRAMILLGINGGFGNTDLAELPVSALDLKRRVIRWHRVKEGVLRVVPLWPETVAAIRAILRPGDDLVFRHADGRPLILNGSDRVIDGFRPILEDLKLYKPREGFYNLRRTCRTIGEETGDKDAARLIMGHTLGGMDEVYVQRFPLPRLVRVSNYVRAWLFRKQAKRVARL